MSGPTRDVPYGPAPWHQTSWDWRAAGNFIFGGIGSGLVVFAALSPASGVALTGLLVTGLVLIGLGLCSVALELGRPFRAINVVRNPMSSWMSREALCAGALVLAVIATIAGVAQGRWLALASALAFLYCQARLLHGGKGIPAWRERRVIPLIVSTGLVEGAGVFWLLAPIHRTGELWLLALFAALVVVRWAVYRGYRDRLGATVPRIACAAIDRAGRALHYLGTGVALVLALCAAVAAPPLAAALAALAGAVACATGAALKFTLVTRAGFNQGFALPQMPVRGARP